MEMERIPAEVFPPGEFLRDELEERGWTQTEFAEIIKRPHRLVNEVISGKRGITPETAKEFGRGKPLACTSAEYWLNLDTVYQLSRTRPVPKDISRNAALREKFPVRDMINRGWIEASSNVEVVETQIFEFFDITSVDDELTLPHAAKKVKSSYKTKEVSSPQYGQK